MSRNTNDSLQTRCVNHCGTIDIYINEGQTFQHHKECLLHMFNSLDYVQKYYFILHDDTNTLHVHFCCMLTKQVRLQTMLNNICTFLDVGVNQVGVERMYNLNAYIRYMLHIDEDKKQYAVQDIFSNDTLSHLEDLIESDNDDINVKRLIQLVLTYADEVDLMYAVGLQIYHKYRYEIKTLYDHTYHLAKKYPHLIPEKNLCKDLPFDD